MSTYKHKLFLVPLSLKEDKYNPNIEAMEKINIFLEEQNYIYVNHTITSLGLDTPAFNGFKYTEVCLAISLVYKDLNDTPKQLKNVSEKTKKIVRSSEENLEVIKQPDYQTEIDKKNDTAKTNDV